MVTLPESVKFLALKPHRRAQFLTSVRRLRRDLAIADNAEFVVAPAAQGNGLGVKPIFRGGLAWITPLLWVCFASALMANFFLNSWLPLIFEGSGLTAKQSGIAISLYHSGGTLGGLLVSLVLGRFGAGRTLSAEAEVAPVIRNTARERTTGSERRAIRTEGSSRDG
jgi:AAHS family 4-hydroxybenzoate transporter-like MFS transporter